MAADFPEQSAEHAAQPDGLLRGVLDALPQGILVFSADRRLVFVNAAAEDAIRASGLVQDSPFSHDSLHHLRDIFQFVDPDTERVLPCDQNPLERALGGDVVEPRDYLIRRHQSANRRWLEISASPLRGPTGALTGAVFAFRNIAARKKRELTLEAAGKLHDVIYQESLAGILRVTVDGRILDCNEAIIRMLRYKSKAELLGARAQQIYYDPLDRDRLVRLLTTTGRLNRSEVCFRRADGSRCWVLVNARLLDPPPGEVGGTIVAIVVDITDRKAQEETLRQSEQRFAAFMYHLPGIAFIKDLSGRYVYYNEAAWRTFGKRPEDFVGKTDEEIWPFADAARYRASDAVVIESGSREFLEPIEQPGGAHSWLIYKFPIVEQGKVVLVAGVGIDITERTILEQQLHEARRMESLGRLAGRVAHDFNNLLTVIAGYGQLATECAGPTPSEPLATYLREILDCSRRATGLTAQLLAFSRRQIPQPKVLNLGLLVRGMEKLLQRVVGEQVELTVRTPWEDCVIEADPNQMEQAILNLAVNAGDAMPLGGHLSFNVDRVTPPITRESRTALSILLEARDDGVGMDEGVRTKIFDPFFTSKEPGKGTGLGLSTVYGAVTQADGRIDVESTPGEGTVFRLYFPEAQSRLDVPVAGQAPAVPHGRETVLLVEDEVSVRTLAETILKRLGYSVLVAESGPEAIEIWDARGGAVDALLTDVIMPQMSGGELADRLRERQPHLRVLFMSGYTDDIIAGHGVMAGETQLIQKPFTAVALARTLRAVLDA